MFLDLEVYERFQFSRRETFFIFTNQFNHFEFRFLSTRKNRQQYYAQMYSAQYQQPQFLSQYAQQQFQGVTVEPQTQTVTMQESIPKN